MGTVYEYGYKIDPSEFTLSDLNLVKIQRAAKDARHMCRGLSDFDRAFQELEAAARNLLALRALHDLTNERS